MTPRRFVDLHTHSTASDGGLSPAELVRQADRARLAAIALTDHDTTDGIEEAQAEAANHPQLTLISGIEISACWPAGTLHLLGLGVDVHSPGLRAMLEELRAGRNQRNPRIVQRLRELGMELDMEEVALLARQRPEKGGVVGRVHIARAMLARGYVSNLPQAFERWIGVGRPAYVDKERLSPREAIRGIRDAGGLAVLAHPVHLNCPNRLQLERVVRDLAAHGLQGIEVFHSDQQAVLTRICLDLALRLKLSVSGGSDFHGPSKPTVRLGWPRVSLAALDDRLRTTLRL